MLLPDIVEISLDYLEKGGKVMIPLVIVSVWMWFLIFRKLLEFYIYKKQMAGGFDCKEKVNRGLLFSGGWSKQIVEEFLRKCSLEPEVDKKLLLTLAKRELAGVEKGVKTILVLASVAPLLGLLGTVSGMITTFDVISAFGTGNARALAAGISEALITTQTGLIIAIPGLFMGNFLNREVQAIYDRMERLVLNFHRLFESDPGMFLRKVEQ